MSPAERRGARGRVDGLPSQQQRSSLVDKKGVHGWFCCFQAPERLFSLCRIPASDCPP